MRFAARTESGAFLAITAASACASSRSRSRGHHAVHEPDRVARARAEIGSAVTISSSATRGGISHGSGAAHGAPRLHFASVIAKRASSAATHRSHICASAKPPA